MKRLFVSLVLVVGLMVASVPSTTAHSLTCGASPHQSVVGKVFSSSANGVTAVSANLRAQSTELAHPCSGGLPITDTGSSNWLALSPINSNVNAIVQIGEIWCDERVPTVPPFGCPVNDNQPHFFWAYGGCNLVLPNGRDLGVVPAVRGRYVDHSFKVSESAGAFHLYIDGNQVKTLSIADTGVACWAQYGSDHNGAFLGNWSGERWYNEDTLGTSLANSSFFDSVQVRYFDLSWHFVGGASACTTGGAVPNQIQCSYDATNHYLRFWD